jgi:hypothetical protein
MGVYNFNKDIVTGQDGEKVVLEHIISMTDATLIDTNHDNKFDFMVDKDGVRRTYEVKTDEYCRAGYDNGNLFVEIECRGKASGIVVTQADWFVFYLPHRKQIWYIESDRLRELIAVNDFRKTENSGDKNSRTIGYLIPRRKFKNHFKVYEL